MQHECNTGRRCVGSIGVRAPSCTTRSPRAEPGEFHCAGPFDISGALWAARCPASLLSNWATGTLSSNHRLSSNGHVRTGDRSQLRPGPCASGKWWGRHRDFQSSSTKVTQGRQFEARHDRSRHSRWRNLVSGKWCAGGSRGTAAVAMGGWVVLARPPRPCNRSRLSIAVHTFVCSGWMDAYRWSRAAGAAGPAEQDSVRRSGPDGAALGR